MKELEQLYDPASIIIDVRSPGEFTHAHIPGAHNIPLFSDKERAEIGTAYKQVSREDAIEIGMKYADPRRLQYVGQLRDLMNGRNNAPHHRPLLARRHALRFNG